MLFFNALFYVLAAAVVVGLLHGALAPLFAP